MQQAEKDVDLIVARLKALRLEQKMSHEKLAEKAGLNRSTISLIEARKRQPTLLSCLRIAAALDCDLAKIIQSRKDSQ